MTWGADEPMRVGLPSGEIWHRANAAAKVETVKVPIRYAAWQFKSKYPPDKARELRAERGVGKWKR